MQTEKEIQDLKISDLELLVGRLQKVLGEKEGKIEELALFMQALRMGDAPPPEVAEELADLRPLNLEMAFDEVKDDGKDDSFAHMRTHEGGVMEKLAGALTSDRQCRLLTGLDIAHLQDLFHLVVPYVQKTVDGGGLRKQKAKFDAWAVSDPGIIFVSLVWCCLYFHHWLMAHFFGLPERYVQKVIRRGMAALNSWAEDASVDNGGIVWPKGGALVDLRAKQERFHYGDVKVGDICVDGCHWPCYKPKNTFDDTRAGKDAYRKQCKSYRNAKHKEWATSILVFCDLSGRVIRVDGPYLGTEASHLKTIVVEDGETLLETCRRDKIAVLADAGLCVETVDSQKEENARRKKLRAQAKVRRARVPPNTEPLNWSNEFRVNRHSVGPKLIRLTKCVWRNLEAYTDEVQEWFAAVYDSTRITSRLRIVVENAIGYARRYRIIALPWRGRSKPGAPFGKYGVPMEEVVKVVFTLANFRMTRGKPLRADDWKPNFAGMIEDGCKFGYPGNPTSAGQLVKPAGAHFADVGRENEKMSLTPAYNVAKKIAKERLKDEANLSNPSKSDTSEMEVALAAAELEEEAQEDVDGIDNAFIYPRLPGEGTSRRARGVSKRK